MQASPERAIAGFEPPDRRQNGLLVEDNGPIHTSKRSPAARAGKGEWGPDSSGLFSGPLGVRRLLERGEPFVEAVRAVATIGGPRGDLGGYPTFSERLARSKTRGSG
jgi:hypothetical protein